MPILLCRAYRALCEEAESKSAYELSVCSLSHSRSEIAEHNHRPAVEAFHIVLLDALKVPCATRSCRISVIRSDSRWHNLGVRDTSAGTFSLEQCAATLAFDLVMSQIRKHCRQLSVSIQMYACSTWEYTRNIGSYSRRDQ